MYHFHNCYTTAETKDRYRQLAKTLHPDKGGTDEAFRELQEQYDQLLRQVGYEPKLPPLFHVDGHYEYFRKPVVYFERDNHWYKFHKDGGADVWIDNRHINLIFEVRLAMAA